ncbi:T9SS type A sorting domain-containing protein, partial [bacterium]|nr:T9SS type A sorting domain-containing protein [bacterium]
MKNLLIILLTPVLLAAQPFTWEQEYDVIPVIVDGDTLAAPWMGGYQDVCPCFGDLDADGDFDLLIGWSNGTFDFWLNEGTEFDEKFTLFEKAVQEIDLNFDLKIELVDMDLDDDLDLFADRGNAPMIILENVGDVSDPYFEIAYDTLFNTTGQTIDGTDFDLVDIDADGDEDLFTGSWYSSGINFYENIGDSLQFSFELITQNFAGINSGSWSSPEFCDIDADGDFDLFIGTSGGWIYFYRNDGTPQQYDYSLVTYQWMGIDVGEKAVPEFCDIDADGDFDLFIGKDNFNSLTIPGALHFWRNEGTPQESQMVQESQMYLTLDFEHNSEPGVFDVNFDNKGDLFVHANYISWLKDIGTVEEPVFELQSYNTTGSGNPSGTIGFGDLNGDTHEDLALTLGWSGIVQFWLSNGDTLNPEFSLFSSLDIGGLIGGPELADMDGDGDNDLIISGASLQFDPYIYYYENQGNSEHPEFVLLTPNYQGWAGSFTVLSVVDFDADEDFDVIAEIDSSDVIIYLENIGTPQNATFAEPYVDFIVPDSLDYNVCDFCDVDNDGDMDAFFGSILGGIRFFRNTTGDTSAVQPRLSLDPLHGIQFSIGPNPANPITWISYNLPYPQKAEIAVYNLLGQKVATLASGLQMPGQKTLIWDAAKYASGQYFVRMET